MKIPEYDEPIMDAIMDRYMAAEAAKERARERASVHALLLIARDGTYQELYQAMRQAFAPPPPKET